MTGENAWRPIGEWVRPLVCWKFYAILSSQKFPVLFATNFGADEVRRDITKS
jgi:hypothetical protein